MTVRPLLPCLAVALALTCATAPAQAAKKNKSTAAAKQPTHTVKFVKSPSQESAAERERRLKRECKGRPNAGACLGYAS
ncbi:MAG: hypothetical protein LBI48_12355 [Burkholderiaceae bacterium]|jgi:hypothetical protein|nr:hypothetical protein [Burkholderiaceae bacterium]